jgi:hypothetical protein
MDLETNLRGRRSALGLLGQSVHPSTHPEPARVSPVFEPLPIQPRPPNGKVSLPAEFLAAFLHQNDACASSEIYETIADLLFCVSPGSNVSSRSTRFRE